MKKVYDFIPRILHRILGSFNSLKMRLTLLFLLCGFAQLFANDVFSQVSNRLTLQLNSTRLEDVLLQIEEQSNYYFIYNRDAVNVDRNVSISCTNKELENVLNELFNGTGIAYTIQEKHIILKAEVSNQEQGQKNKRVSGKVTDSTGQPLPGVSVVIKESTIGTTTDFEGHYSLNNVPGDAILQFSFIGMKPQEVSVAKSEIINLVLEDETIGIDEVVAIGYGTQSKRFVTGSISSVDMLQEGRDLPNTNVAQTLNSIPGIQFKGDGRPGQDGSLLIRGQNSLSGNTTPLIVLDGIIFSGTLSDINPQDIESIDILKDASSATVYGSRASNGVMLIKTKKGKSEKPMFRFNTFYGVSNPGHEMKLLSADRYIQRKLDWAEQEGTSSSIDDIGDYLSTSELSNYQNGISHNPWDVISQNSNVYSVDVNVSARTQYINYYLSYSYTDEKGLIYNDDLLRHTFRANVGSQIKDWLNIGMDATFSSRDVSDVEAGTSWAYRASPFSTYYYDDGNPTQYSVLEEQAGANPMYNALMTTNEEVYQNLFSNFYADIDLHFVDGLKYRINFSPNMMWNHEYNYVRQDPYLTNNNTSASKYNENKYNWVLENIVTYNKTLNEDNAFDLTFLYGLNHSQYESTLASASQLSVDGLGYNNLGLGGILSNTSDAEKTDGTSLMARLNYRFKNKYLFTLTARRDGSSVFAENNKYATFPSGSFAWIMSEEPFVKSIDFVDMLKLRMSYGSVGNQAISPYQSLSLSDIQRIVLGDDSPSRIAVVTSSLGNNNLKWETTTSLDFAVDFELFKSVLKGTIEGYNSKTTDLLVNRSIPLMNGYSSILSNIGEVNNRGIEFSLNTRNISTTNFSWTSSFSLAYNRNKIIHLYGEDLDGDGLEDNDISNSWFIGKPINSYYDYEFAGIYQEGDSDIPSGQQAGFVRVKDFNGDGTIDSNDRKVVASGENPKYQLSFRNNFQYKNFSFSFSLSSMLGWKAPFDLINPLVPGRSLGSIDVGWWTGENKSNDRPSLVYSNPLGTNWYMSRNFLRIKDISVAYEFDKQALSKMQIDGLRIYVSAKNLYTFTNWLGQDPENTSGYTDEQGYVDMYPMPRTFSAGLSVTF